MAAYLEKIRNLYRSGMSLSDIGRQFGKDHTTIAHHLMKMGDNLRGKGYYNRVQKEKKTNRHIPKIFLHQKDAYDSQGRPIGQSYKTLLAKSGIRVAKENW